MSLDVGSLDQVPRREIWVPVWDDTHAQVSITSCFDHVALLMAANQDVTVRFNFKVPVDFHSLVAARLVVFTAVANPTLRYSIDTDWGACGEAPNAHSDIITLHDEELTQSINNCLDLDAALDGVEPEDNVGVLLTRNGAHVNDDAGDTYILGFFLQYR